MKFFSMVISLVLLFTDKSEDDKIIELPITFVNGYGNLLPGFAHVGKQMDPQSTWFKTDVPVKGIPDHWTKVNKVMFWFNGRQFAFQNFKQGNLSEDFFNELVESWNIDFTKQAYSEKPIKCFTNAVYGRDQNGDLKYKVDANNNLDFTDDVECIPAKHDWTKLDSLAKHASQMVKYEAYKNGRVHELTAPLLIVEINGSLFRNFPQYGLSELNGTKILVFSGDFGSTDFESVSICEFGKNLSVQECVKQNEFINIGGYIFQNLGVDTERQTLKLKKMAPDTAIYSSQIGFHAKPFIGNDFKTQEKLNLELFKGKFLFLEFWGSWCGPCLMDIPNLKKAYHEIDKTRIDFLGIANDDAESLRKILEKEKIDWKQILCKKEGGIIDDYNIQSYPTSYLIDPTGRIVAKNLAGIKLLDTLNYYISKKY